MQGEEHFIPPRRNPDFVMPNHPIANKMTEIQNNLPLDVPIRKYCIRSFTVTCKLEDTKGPVLTAYDHLIFDAICTICDAGNEFFTAKTVWRVANGLSSDREPHTEQLQKVVNSIEKLRKTMVYFDATEEFKARDIRVKDAHIDGNMISCVRGVYRMGKETIAAYKMACPPLILTHSKRTSQIIRIPYELMDVRRPDGTPLYLNDQRMVLKRLLIHRISWEKKNTFRIEIDGIAKKLDKSLKTRKERQSLRDDIEIILAFLKQNGFIQDFEAYRKGRAIAGYIVMK